MAGEGNGSDRISVSRDTLRAELAEMELRIARFIEEKLNSRAEVERLARHALSDRLATVEKLSELWLASYKDQTTTEGRVGRLESWQSKVIGALLVIGVAISLISIKFVFHVG